jgi:hypothetical protein
VLIRDNRRAFFASLVACAIGCLLLVVALVGREVALTPFAFMVMVGLGLYLPYVAVHTTVFERMLAMTRQHGTITFLMYVADAFGYLGYVAVMLARHMVADAGGILGYFVGACWIAAAMSLVALAVAWRYFARGQETELVAAAEVAG